MARFGSGWVLALAAASLSCGDAGSTQNADGIDRPGDGLDGDGLDGDGTGDGSDQATDATDGPGAGLGGDCTLAASEARLEDVSNPTTVVGDGTRASCTSAAFVAAVANGGTITFDCGADPVTITLEETAKVFNDKGPKIVIDGGGKVTLSGGGKHRILYMNTCDEAQVWTTPTCDNQDHPQLTLQNLTFVDGNAKGLDPAGGGAIFARGGRLKVLNSRFFGNVCEDVGPDVGGGAIRAFDQFDDQPLFIVRSTFGGEEALGNVCSNGGALSSIGVSYTVIDSLLSYNRAIGNGANPAKDGTPGGGSGGAIYNDGNTFTLTLCGTTIEHNVANEGGGAVFYVSNDGSGSFVIRDATLRNNESKGGWDNYPGMFVKTNREPEVVDSTLE